MTTSHLKSFLYFVVWMVSTHPLISNFSSPLSKLRVSFRVHQLQLVSPSISCSITFFSSVARPKSCFSFRFFFCLFFVCLFIFYFHSVVCKVHYSVGFLFLFFFFFCFLLLLLLLIIAWSGLLASIR